MNDVWDAANAEPLDDTSLGLLAAFREEQGPSEEAQARMLAGLRSRVAAEPTPEDVAPAPATTPKAVPVDTTASTSSNTRTVVIAAVAFAAGVMLTVGLGDRARPQSAPPTADRVAQQHTAPAARLGAPAPLTQTPNTELLSTDAAPAWPLSMADLQAPAADPSMGPTKEKPPEGPVHEAPNALTSEVEGRSEEAPEPDTEPATHGTRRSGALNPDDDALAQRNSTRTRDGQNPTRGNGAGVRGSATGAWAPSLSPTTSVTGIGAAARNAAVGGSSPATAPGPARSGSSNGGDNASPGGDANANDGAGDGPSDDPAQGDPASDEPEQGEPDDEGEEDAPSPEEQCATEFDACMNDAHEYCEFDPEACESLFDFCGHRDAICLGEPPPPPMWPDPDEPPHDDCDMQYDICLMEADTYCAYEKIQPEECDDLYFACDAMLGECHGAPPYDPGDW